MFCNGFDHNSYYYCSRIGGDLFSLLYPRFFVNINVDFLLGRVLVLLW